MFGAEKKWNYSEKGDQEVVWSGECDVVHDIPEKDVADADDVLLLAKNWALNVGQDDHLHLLEVAIHGSPLGPFT